VSGRSVLLRVLFLAMLVVAGGCAKPQQLPFAPRSPVQPTFSYEPMPCRPAAAVPAERPKPVVQPAPQPRLPDHDPAWVVNGPERPWRYIVIHHSATPCGSAASFDNWHRNHNGWDELGYHFVIGNGTLTPDGCVEVGSRWTKQKHGAHCRVGDDETYNDWGIGICLVGDFEHDRPTEAQMDALARLVDYLRVKYAIPDRCIIGHGDVDTTRCPGRYFSFGNLFSRLRQRQAAREAGSPPRGRRPIR